MEGKVKQSSPLSYTVNCDLKSKPLFFRLQLGELYGRQTENNSFFFISGHSITLFCNIRQLIKTVTRWIVSMRTKVKILQHKRIDTDKFFKTRIHFESKRKKLRQYFWGCIKNFRHSGDGRQSEAQELFLRHTGFYWCISGRFGVSDFVDGSLDAADSQCQWSK